jgi:hypothetical protein
MATTLESIAGFLDEYELNYRVDRDRSAILIAFACPPEDGGYTTPDGEATVRIVIQLAEDGEFLAVFSPNAWNIHDCAHKSAVIGAVPAIQSQYKMLRFDHDPADGELRPNIELPLEDASLTSQQFHRIVHGLLEGIQRFDRVIRHAMETGEVSFACLEKDEPSAPSPDEVQRLMELANRAGGIEELERLIGAGGLQTDTDFGPNDSSGSDGSDDPGRADKAA